jgi:hypothetical protein
VVRLGVSMPAVTTRLEMTKQDMRKGRKTGWPVSVCVRSISFGAEGGGPSAGAHQDVMSSPQSSSLSIFQGSSSCSLPSCRTKRAFWHFRGLTRIQRVF